MKIDEGLWIGGHDYVWLRLTALSHHHTLRSSDHLMDPSQYDMLCRVDKVVTTCHYYAMWRRSEPTRSGDLGWYTIDDSQIKPTETSLLAGNRPEKLVDDNAIQCLCSLPVLQIGCADAWVPSPFATRWLCQEGKEGKKQWGTGMGSPSISKISPPPWFHRRGRTWFAQMECWAQIQTGQLPLWPSCCLSAISM